MTITTLLKYLCGSRRAILEIAACPQSIWLGLTFVFSAAFAREYDGVDLWHQPWHLALPLAASLATSMLLYLLASVVTGRRRRNLSLARYASFLSLYWMTAPLAWLYAIPVERCFAPETATAVNLWLLGIVAVWRVVLMMRVIATVFHVGGGLAFFMVMFFADTVLLVILRLTPLPIFQLMGGIRLSTSERTIQNAAFIVGFAGVISWLVWLVGMLIAARGLKSQEDVVAQSARVGQVSRSLWIMAACSIGVWVGILPFTQPEQQLRWRVERDLRAGRLQEAAALLATHERSDFPPHWDPPPRIGYGETFPPAQNVFHELLAAKAKAWALALYADKFANEARRYNAELFSDALPDAVLEEKLSLVEQLPNAAEIIEEHRRELDREARNEDRSEAVRDRIRRVLQETGTGNADEAATSVPFSDQYQIDSSTNNELNFGSDPTRFRGSSTKRSACWANPDVTSCA